MGRFYPTKALECALPYCTHGNSLIAMPNNDPYKSDSVYINALRCRASRGQARPSPCDPLERGVAPAHVVAATTRLRSVVHFLVIRAAKEIWASIHWSRGRPFAFTFSAAFKSQVDSGQTAIQLLPPCDESFIACFSTCLFSLRRRGMRAMRIAPLSHRLVPLTRQAIRADETRADNFLARERRHKPNLSGQKLGAPRTETRTPRTATRADRNWLTTQQNFDVLMHTCIRSYGQMPVKCPEMVHGIVSSDHRATDLLS